MEDSKRKQIEARLQELFARNDSEMLKTEKTERIIHTPRRTVRVIRRRKGQPDLQLA